MRYIAGVVLACLVAFVGEAHADFVQIDPFADSQVQGAGSQVLNSGSATGATRSLTGTTGLLGNASRIQGGILSATFFEGNGSFLLTYDFTTMTAGFLDISEAAVTAENGFTLESFLSNHDDVGQGLEIRWNVNSGGIDVTQDYEPGEALVLQDQSLPDQLTSLALTFTYTNDGGNGISTFNSGQLLAVPEPGTVGIAIAACGLFGVYRLRRKLTKKRG